MVKKGQKLRTYSAKEKAEAVKAVADGMSVPEVAAILNTNPNNIRYWVKQAKITAKTAGPYKCPDCEKEYKTTQALGIHREAAHGVPGYRTKTRKEFPPEVTDRLMFPAPAPVPPGQETAPQTGKTPWTVEEFVEGLETLIKDYKRIKTALAEKDRSIETWKRLAGKAQEQLNAMAASMSLK